MISENKIITGLVWRNENSEPRTIRERIKLYYRVIQTTTYVFLENGFEFLRNAHLCTWGRIPLKALLGVVPKGAKFLKKLQT